MCDVLCMNLLRWLLLAQLIPGVPIPAAPPTTEPSAQAQQQPPATQPESLVGALQKTRFAQYFSGEKVITWDDVRSPVFWIDTVRDFVVAIVGFIPRFIGTMVFLFVFWLIYRGIRRVAIGHMKKGEVDSSIRDMLATLIKWCVMGFGIVIACNQLGIPIVAMLTGVSIIGLAVGFAAQETLANFIAGIVIFLDKPFKPGDWIDVTGTFGQVRRVSFRSTRIVNLDGEVIVFPNTFMLSNRVANHSTNPINRINLPIGISYKASISDARRVLLKLTENDSRIVKDPPPEVVVAECGDSSVNLLLRFWIADESLERRIGYEYLEKMKDALDAAGIDIPYPHMQLLLEHTTPLETLNKGRSAAA
jgi:small conductance mechanosensitive channel